MRRCRHILVAHCKGRQHCQWLRCIICNGYGHLDGKRWAVNPYKFAEEPNVHNN